MRLAHLSADNFRIYGSKANAANLDLAVRPGLTLLVGQNDSGKSAIVDALRLLSLRKSGRHALHYHRSPVSWIRAMDFEPYFKSAIRTRSDDHLRDLFVENKDMVKGLGAILNSTHFFCWFITQGNCRDIVGSDIENFPVGNFCDVASSLAPIFDKLMVNLRENSRTRVYNYETSGRVEYQEFYPGLSKPILDEIDTVLAKHYGFTDEELDFIINYDIKYRLGRNTEEK